MPREGDVSLKLQIVRASSGMPEVPRAVRRLDRSIFSDFLGYTEPPPSVSAKNSTVL